MVGVWHVKVRRRGLRVWIGSGSRLTVIVFREELN